MRDYEDEDNNHDYSPNELAHLSVRNRDKFEKIVKQNLAEGDTIEKWQQRNLDYAKKCLDQQR